MLHNIPEGLATYFSASLDRYTVPAAMAIHNIPEGIAVCVPTFLVSQSCSKAMFHTLISKQYLRSPSPIP